MALAACLSSCAATSSNAAIEAGDAGPVLDAVTADASEPEHDLGTGEPGQFVRVSDGQTVLLQRGCQGAQHIFFSLRSRGVRIDTPAWITLSVSREGDGRVVSSAYSLRLMVTSTSDGVGALTGLTPVIEEPSDVLGQWVAMEALMEDGARAQRASARRRVMVRWGPDSCRPHG